MTKPKLLLFPKMQAPTLNFALDHTLGTSWLFVIGVVIAFIQEFLVQVILPIRNRQRARILSLCVADLLLSLIPPNLATFWGFFHSLFCTHVCQFEQSIKRICLIPKSQFHFSLCFTRSTPTITAQNSEYKFQVRCF
jgi:hypothetical protein